MPAAASQTSSYPGVVPPCAPPEGRWRALSAAVLRQAAVMVLVCGVAPAGAQQPGRGPANDGGPQGGGGGMPLISSDDPGIAGLVLDGPSEPAGWQALGAGAGPLAAPDDLPLEMNRLVAPLPPPPEAPAPAVEAPATLPVVVEMFTAQGCSSCPPADALLAELAGRPDVLPLAFHVDYWDYLGWVDQFARPEFTDRQEAYARVTGERAIYTPQIIVDGADTLIDLAPASLETLIAAHEAAPSRVAIHLDAADQGGLRIDLWPLGLSTGPATVDLVRFVPRREVRISAGENRGRVVTYRNVVTSVERLSTWDGKAPLRLTVAQGGVEPEAPDSRHAILVQKLARGHGLGPVLAAVPID